MLLAGGLIEFLAEIQIAIGGRRLHNEHIRKPDVYWSTSNKRTISVHKFLTVLPLIVLVAACSDNENFEDKGRQADAEQAQIEANARIAREKAQGVQREVRADLKKVDNAVEAADAELKK